MDSQGHMKRLFDQKPWGLIDLEFHLQFRTISHHGILILLVLKTNITIITMYQRTSRKCIHMLNTFIHMLPIFYAP